MQTKWCGLHGKRSKKLGNMPDEKVFADLTSQTKWDSKYFWGLFSRQILAILYGMREENWCLNTPMVKGKYSKPA